MMNAEMKALRLRRYKSRKLVNVVALLLSLMAMAFGLFWLIWILIETVRLGVGGLAWATLTQMTPAPGDEGGLANAIMGSLLMVGMGVFFQEKDERSV